MRESEAEFIGSTGTRAGSGSNPAPIGPAGSMEPLKRHHEVEDFIEGYFPHTLCVVGAMCAQCAANLKINNETK